AFVFLGSASGIANGSPATAHTVLRSNRAGAFMGFSVASAGDVNGDGYADVIVGAPSLSFGQDGEGAALVFLGSVSGIADGSPETAYAWLRGNQVSANLGWAVASAGDVNGDGHADVTEGGPTFGQAGDGAALVFHGGASGIADGRPASEAGRLESNQPGAELGASVASAGDVNGDGYGDVIVGAPLYDDGQSNEGAAFVFHGGPGGINDAIPVSANTELQGDQPDALLGTSVASAGDVNGDG